MQSAYQQSKVISDYLKAEIEVNSIAGPFKEPLMLSLHINRFSAIPRSTPGKWLLITDLSYLQGLSVTDVIPMQETLSHSLKKP